DLASDLDRDQRRHRARRGDAGDDRSLVDLDRRVRRDVVPSREEGAICEKTAGADADGDEDPEESFHRHPRRLQPRDIVTDARKALPAPVLDVVPERTFCTRNQNYW